MKKQLAENSRRLKKLPPPVKNQTYQLLDDFDEHPEFKYMLSAYEQFGWDSYLRIKPMEKDRPSIHIYSPYLAHMLSSNSIKLKVARTQKIQEFATKHFQDIYIEGYFEGLDYFKHHYDVSGEIIYGANGHIFERTLHRLYFHPPVDSIVGEWKRFRNFGMQSFELSSLRKKGFYAGLIYCTDRIRKIHPIVFSKFEECHNVANHNSDEVQLKSDDNTNIILSNLRHLKGKWKSEKIMSDADFKAMVLNIQYLIENKKLPENIQMIKINSDISMDLIRKSFHKLYKSSNTSIKPILWVKLIHASFAKFNNTAEATTVKLFSKYNKNFNNDIASITY